MNIYMYVNIYTKRERLETCLMLLNPKSTLDTNSYLGPILSLRTEKKKKDREATNSNSFVRIVSFPSDFGPFYRAYKCTLN